VGKHFVLRATLKTLLLPGAAYITFIASIIASKILTKAFYIS